MDCYRCKRPDLTEDDFCKGNNRCRKCHREYQAERRERLAKERPPPDTTGTKKCSTCGNDKPKKQFGVSRGIKDGLQPQCMECRRKSRKKYNTTQKGHIQNMVAAARQRARQKHLQFSITTQDITDLWELQKGLCCLSGELLLVSNDTDYHIASRHPAGPSIDRINCDLGYVSGNIRLVTTIMNLAIGTWGEDVLQTIAISLAKRQGYLVRDQQGAVL